MVEDPLAGPFVSEFLPGGGLQCTLAPGDTPYAFDTCSQCAEGHDVFGCFNGVCWRGDLDPDCPLDGSSECQNNTILGGTIRWEPCSAADASAVGSKSSSKDKSGKRGTREVVGSVLGGLAMLVILLVAILEPRRNARALKRTMTRAVTHKPRARVRTAPGAMVPQPQTQMGGPDGAAPDRRPSIATRPRFCQECGSDLDDGSKFFCMQCGHPVHDIQV